MEQKKKKKVKIIGKEEYTYSGKPRIISKNGKVKEIFFYDEKDLLVKKWSGTWNNHFDLLSFEYDIEQNIAERKVAEGYNKLLLHTKTIFREKETNTYEETFCWDNGNLNTVIIYEEVEQKEVRTILTLKSHNTYKAPACQ